MKIKTVVLFFSVILIPVVVSLFIAITYIPKANVGWDEATHIWWAYQVYESLLSRNFSSFWQVTTSQVYYPPLQSWLYGLPLLLSGFSIEKVRTLGLLWFILAGFLIFVLGAQLGDKRKTSVGSLSLFFFLSSPMMLLFSSFVMKEMIGMVFSLLLTLTYFWARSKRTPFPYVLVALTLFILTMIKYNFGFLMAMVVFLETAAVIIFSKKREAIFISHLFIFVPFSLLLGFWLFFPYNNFCLTFQWPCPLAVSKRAE